ncbi:MAG: FtsX-like permease family protein [Patescibacteria group bacterium]
MLKLAIKNIKERKFRSLLASFTIAIGTASLIVFLGLSDGIKQATFSELEKQSPLNQITVRPNNEKASPLSFIGSSKNKITDETIAQIAKIDGVTKVYPEIQYSNFSSLEIELLGESLVTDTMLFGVPKGFIENDLENPEDWDKTSEPYPVIVPRKLLDLYNLTVATSQDLPKLSEEILIGARPTLYPNYSTFFPVKDNQDEKIELEVVGFSDKVNFIGVTLPDNILKELNQKFNPEKPTNYIELFVETKDATLVPQVAAAIEKLDLSTFYLQKNLKDVEAKFTYLKITLGFISFVILLTAAISIISTFLATISERTKEIGLFRALGASKSHIKKLILIEAGIVGIVGSCMGIVLGLIGSVIIDQVGIGQLAQTTFTADTLFKITPALILQTLIFGTLLALISAYIPARKAANISPVKALNRL